MINYNPKILIVDDISKNIQIVANILKSENYLISFANNGKKAVGLCQEANFDLILLDVMMPELNGFEACLQIKEISTYKDVPIIFLTAKSDTDSVLKAFEVGGVDYVIKPFNAKELLLRVKTQIKLRELTHKLVQTEKIIALGSLVAGVAHEINTPVGVAVTATSKMDSKTKKFSKFYKSNELTKYDLDNYLASMQEGLSITFKNLERASELIQSFKQVAVDQSSEEKRKFKLCEYLNETLISLKPKFKNKNYIINLNCNMNLELNSYAGVYSQIFTNLILNSIIHGFKNLNSGEINIDILIKNLNLIIEYKDNGVGIDENNLKKVFEPFFTTNRENGGSGLGMHIVYNLITQKLNGKIDFKSEKNRGIEFLIIIPLKDFNE